VWIGRGNYHILWKVRLIKNLRYSQTILFEISEWTSVYQNARLQNNIAVGFLHFKIFPAQSVQRRIYSCEIVKARNGPKSVCNQLAITNK